MKASRITIRNVLGIEELTFVPSATGVTVVRGPNASGKTSVIAALRSIVHGGHDITLLRQGATEGEVAILMDNGVEVRKRFTQEKSTLDVTLPEAGKISAPKTYLEKLISSEAFNPVEFLEASRERRLGLLLKAAPGKVDPVALDGFLGQVRQLCPTENIPPRGPSLDLIDCAEAICRGERTVANRLVKEKITTAEQLRKALPTEISADPRGELALAEKVVADLVAGYEAGVGKINRAAADSVQAECLALQQEADKFIAQKRAEAAGVHRVCEDDIKRFREQIAKIEDLIRDRQKADDEAARRADLLVKERQAKLGVESSAVRARVVEEAGLKKDQARAAIQPAIDQARAKVALKQKAVEEAARFDETRKFIQSNEEDARRFTARAESLGTLIVRAGQLRQEILKDLPIDGLTVREGEIMVKGVPFDRLSQAEQVEVALAIARFNAGDLKLVVVDGAERLDPARFEAFRQRVEEWGLQLIATRVDEGAFRIEA